MKISIITATYNSAATLRDTLESVKQQDYDNIEHIIVDGASKDDTLRIVEDYQHIAKVISEPDAGIYDAMNKGVRLATGDIIGILNSDDFYPDKEVISIIADFFIKEKVDSVYGDLKYVDKNNINKVVRYWKAKPFQKKNFLYGWMPPHPTFFVHRTIYERFGDFDLSLKSAADYELMLRFLYKHEISTVYIPKVLVQMRTGGQSNVNLLNRVKANREDLLAWHKNNLTPKFYTTYLKPIRKVSQFLKHE